MLWGVVHSSFNRHKLIFLVLWVRRLDGLSLAGFSVQGVYEDKSMLLDCWSLPERLWQECIFQLLHLPGEYSSQPQVSVSSVALIRGKLGILRILVLVFSILDPKVVHSYLEYGHSTAVLLNKCVKWAHFCKPEQLLCKVYNLSHNCEFSHTFIT